MKEGETVAEGDMSQVTAAADTRPDSGDNDKSEHDQDQAPGHTETELDNGGVVTTEPEYHEAESEETSPGQHNSSGYASDGSGAGGSGDTVQCPDNMTHAMGHQQSGIQSDPHQSAFRPAGIPGMQQGPMTPQYPAPEQHMGQQPGHDYQYRQNGGPGHNWTGHDDMAAAGYCPPIGMMTQAAPHPMTGHPQMHTPIARRPITGNMSGYPPNPGYRPQPGQFPTSPGGGPQHNQYRQAPAGPGYSGGQCGGWGSPSWSGNGPPSGPPPISMTPPPLSWNQAPNRRPHNYQGGNKPFGSIQYGCQVMQQNPIRSKNYPFPSKALNPGQFKLS